MAAHVHVPYNRMATNPKLTLSAGIGFRSPGTPIRAKDKTHGWQEPAEDVLGSLTKEAD